MKAAVLLFATTMFCFTKDFVCTMTRAQLMTITGIRTSASFAAAVRELMGHSLLSPKDGAPRTPWYLGEAFWGGLLADEELDTPVATLARRRKSAGLSRGKRSAAAGAARAGRHPAREGGKPARGRSTANAATGAENRTGETVAPAGGPGKSSTGVENRTSESAREGRRQARAVAGAAEGTGTEIVTTAHAVCPDGETGTWATPDAAGGQGRREAPRRGCLDGQRDRREGARRLFVSRRRRGLEERQPFGRFSVWRQCG